MVRVTLEKKELMERSTQAAERLVIETQEVKKTWKGETAHRDMYR